MAQDAKVRLVRTYQLSSFILQKKRVLFSRFGINSFDLFESVAREHYDEYERKISRIA